MYITSSSYLNLIKNFKYIYLKKRDDSIQKIDRI